MGKAVKRLATGVAIGALVTMIPGAGAYAAMALQGGMAATAVGAITGNKKLMQFGSDLSAVGGGMSLGNFAQTGAFTEAAGGVKQNDWGSTFGGDTSGIDAANKGAGQPVANTEVAQSQPVQPQGSPEINQLGDQVSQSGDKLSVSKFQGLQGSAPQSSGIINSAAEQPSWWSGLDKTDKMLTVQGGTAFVSAAMKDKAEKEAEAKLQAEKDRVRNSNNDYVRLAYGGNRGIVSDQYKRRY